jgi:hypothetical protein
LLLASCATPEPKPPPELPARTTAQPTQAPADTAQQPKIVQAQALLMGRPLVVPPEVVAPRTGVLAPRTGVMAPETVGPAPVGKVPPLIIVHPPEVPEKPASPETTKPPVPVIVNPPKVDEREPEEAARKDRPPQPPEVAVADQDWRPAEPNAPRYLPCSYVSLGGSGPFRPEKAPADWVRCYFRCGRYQVKLNDIRMPKPDDSGKPQDERAICEKWIKRAENEARSYDAALRARGK